MMPDTPLPVAPSVLLDPSFRARMRTLWTTLAAENRALAEETGRRCFSDLADSCDRHRDAAESDYGTTSLGSLLDDVLP